jgi:hypothetical protein
MVPRTSLTTRARCRICDSPELTPILSLGEHEFLDRGGKFIVPVPAVKIVPESYSPELPPRDVSVASQRGI